MSMQAINFALTLPVDEPGPRLLLLLIAHHINWQTGDMFVSQEALAVEARMTSRSVRNHLTSLEDAGSIIRIQTRDESGRRGIDRIILVGYLEWQSVLYNGGTIPSPESRRKKAQEPAENSSGSAAANRKNGVDQPEKNRSPTGSSFPVYKEPSLTLKEPLERAGAHATQGAARPAQSEVPAPSPVLVLPSDGVWRSWVNWLIERGHVKAVKAFEAEGAMVVFAQSPADGVRPPALPPKTDSDRFAELMAKRERSAKNITGEAA